MDEEYKFGLMAPGMMAFGKVVLLMDMED